MHYTKEQAAKKLKISERTVDRWVAKNRLFRIWHDGGIKIRSAEVDAIVSNGLLIEGSTEQHQTQGSA